jgi:alpha-glucosidase (family GH31 glycosyl hydrolase)
MTAVIHQSFERSNFKSDETSEIDLNKSTQIQLESSDMAVPLIIKKNSIKNRSDEMAYEDRLYVLQILKQQLPVSKIIQHADGCRINLDSLTDDTINKIYHIIKMKLKISHTNKI